ncbi:hypothetical protein FC70_GL000779 [Paucilactobacillus oligofermentans DSM 15707 = LMG 22743]|uniref:Bacteriocin immunity protein n=1 Tax=Paucilactobacillus oligofermentans DSM 15707 = LMG 22743 TaxID=1423778 RepID=A0A0R1RDZ2_9LACO|nr:bacteriocin immunity protein [Paucilactobacillus oligofermentans]KRL55183.1 hypothetical protein FC70_GL000779 [Paucilactobacillus oligofermentans DSM 15707 = LMG 22743]CUS25828.1 Putative bacteriocin immunity protein [Paucilactobacillus oligofermentans DSM 15707 = LMG 22743]
MRKLNWFSGGTERSDQAETIIHDLLNQLPSELRTAPLQKVLTSYLKELERKDTSVPLILSRMNLDIAKTIRNNKINLTEFQSQKLKELTNLSSIRYGY